MKSDTTKQPKFMSVQVEIAFIKKLAKENSIAIMFEFKRARHTLYGPINNSKEKAVTFKEILIQSGYPNDMVRIAEKGMTINLLTAGPNKKVKKGRKKDPRKQILEQVIKLLESIGLYPKKVGEGRKDKWQYTRNRITTKTKDILLIFNESEDARKAAILLADNGLNPRTRKGSMKVTVPLNPSSKISDGKRNTKTTPKSLLQDSQAPADNPIVEFKKKYGEAGIELINLLLKLNQPKSDDKFIVIRRTEQAEAIINSIAPQGKSSPLFEIIE